MVDRTGISTGQGRTDTDRGVSPSTTSVRAPVSKDGPVLGGSPVPGLSNKTLRHQVGQIGQVEFPWGHGVVHP